MFQHIQYTLIIVGIALIVAFPIAVLALQRRWLRTSILSLLAVVYTIPSLALFVLLQPAFGVTKATPVLIALIAYAQLLLVRNIVVGLEEVPGEVLEAARGTGYSPLRLLFQVRLPLALPAILGGLRITVVSTISLLAVGGLIGQGGLGQLMFDGYTPDDIKSQVLTALVLIVALALVADLLLLLLQRVLTPWTRARRLAR